MPKDESKRYSVVVTGQHLELVLLALTLFATVLLSFLTHRQTTHHFRIERTSSFVARFNSAELVALREHVDRWLESGETIPQLFARSADQPDAAQNPNSTLGTDDAVITLARLRTMANFFQEFGTALKADSLDESYAHELLGGVCIRYGDSLEPYIIEMRRVRKRPQVYQEVLLLRDRMRGLDK